MILWFCLELLLISLPHHIPSESWRDALSDCLKPFYAEVAMSPCHWGDFCVVAMVTNFDKNQQYQKNMIYTHQTWLKRSIAYTTKHLWVITLHCWKNVNCSPHSYRDISIATESYHSNGFCALNCSIPLKGLKSGYEILF